MTDTYGVCLHLRSGRSLKRLGLSVDEVQRVVKQVRSGVAFRFDGEWVEGADSYKVVRFTESEGAVRHRARTMLKADRAPTTDELSMAFSFGVDATREFDAMNEKEVTMGGAAQKIFVVHGRDSGVRKSFFALLRAFGLDPVEWNTVLAATNQPSPYIGEALRTGLQGAAAIVVLMTPDDEGRLREKYRGAHEPAHEIELTGQARLNVVFEAGMAFAQFPLKTVLVEVGRLRPFSDISGVHVLRFGGSADDRVALAQRLRTAGCVVSMEGTDWLSAGDFS